MDALVNFFTRPRLVPLTAQGSQRVLFVDIAKGLGIILVVWYHSVICPNPLLNRFFMPLFFLLSGMFFKPADAPGVFIRKKWHELVAPFLLFLLISVALEHWCYGWKHWHIRYTPYWTFEQIGNVPLWFLISLAFTQIIAYGIEHWMRPRWSRAVLTVGVCALGWWLAARQIRIFYLSQSLLVYPFFIGGFLLRRHILRGDFTALWVLVMGLVFIVYGEVCRVHTNIHRLQITTGYVPTLVAATGWIVWVLTGCVLLGRSRLGRALAWVGRGSLMVLGLHMVVFTPIIEFVFPRLGLYPEVAGFSTNMLVSLAFALAVTVVARLLGELLRRALPIVFTPPPYSRYA